MLSERFSHVDAGVIIKTGIKRGASYLGKNNGTLSPDSEYVAKGLYPEIGERPVYDSDTQNISRPTFTIGIKQVFKTWVISEKSIQELAKKAQVVQSRLGAVEARANLISNTSPATTIEELRQRVSWMEKIILNIGE